MQNNSLEGNILKQVSDWNSLSKQVWCIFCWIDWTVAHRLNLTGYQTVAIFLVFNSVPVFDKYAAEKFFIFPYGKKQLNNISKLCHDYVPGLYYFIDSWGLF